VRVRAAQDPGIELSWQPDVVGVAGAAGNLLGTLDAQVPMADRRQLCLSAPGGSAASSVTSNASWPPLPRSF
jgi:hypothetical protein